MAGDNVAAGTESLKGDGGGEPGSGMWAVLTQYLLPKLWSA